MNTKVEACFALYVGIIAFLAICGNGERISQQIYHSLQGNLTCFRRLNATHTTGCSSPRSGSVGVVMLMDGSWDLDWLLEEGARAPYIVALEPHNFTRSVLLKLNASEKINGVVLLKSPNSHPSDGFSSDTKCPNRGYGIYNTSDKYEGYCDSEPWNAIGSGLLYENFKFPIVLFNQHDDIMYIQDHCYGKFNQPSKKEEKPWPLCAIELKTPMYAAVDTPTCLRRSGVPDISLLLPRHMCEPLHDRNIYASLVSVNKSEPFSNHSVMVLSARMDATSMFEGVAPGVDTTVSALVSLIAVAQTLKEYQRQFQEKKKNVFYVLLNGESFDYIGSSRLVYDMEHDDFPQKLNEDVESQLPLLNTHHISHWLELNQVSFIELYNRSTLFLHSDPISTRDTDVKKAVKELKDAIRDLSSEVGLDIVSVDDDTPLPPASFQRVLWKDDRVPGVVVSNHRQKFLSRFYNSIFDAPYGEGYINHLTKHLEKVVTLTSRSVYKVAMGEEPPVDMRAENQTIRDLLMCYVITPNCSIWRKVYSGWLPPHPLPLYVSVDAVHSPSTFVRLLTHHTLAYLSGKETNLTKSKCKNDADDQIHHYLWATETDEYGNETGSCINSTVHLKAALSPAFIIKDYDYSSGLYSTWTESVWENPRSRVFLKPSWNQEATIVAVGSTVMVFSFSMTYLVKIRASVLFPQG